jgi:hypothetical protein
MDKEEFIEKIQAHRKRCEGLMEGDGGYKIRRGMAHVISGYVEDLFALFIAKNLNQNDLEYYVDKVTSIRFNQNEKAKSFKPDLSIVNNTIMSHYFDLKTNMGWNRHFEEYLKEKNDFIDRLKGEKAWIHWDEKDQQITISPNLKYQMVVVFGWNINQKLLKENLIKAKAFSNVEVHVLYTNKIDGAGYEINEQAFDDIIKSVKA